MKGIIFLLVLFIFITACTKTVCESGLYTKDGKCCTYVCNTECPSGYKEGTCNCECEESPVPPATSGDAGDINIDDIFDDSGDVKPPELPSP